jgi:hypothetical protein
MPISNKVDPSESGVVSIRGSYSDVHDDGISRIFSMAHRVNLSDWIKLTRVLGPCVTPTHPSAWMHWSRRKT